MVGRFDDGVDKCSIESVLFVVGLKCIEEVPIW
jgi:hypothetical protein